MTLIQHKEYRRILFARYSTKCRNDITRRAETRLPARTPCNNRTFTDVQFSRFSSVFGHQVPSGIVIFGQIFHITVRKLCKTPTASRTISSIFVHPSIFLFSRLNSTPSSICPSSNPFSITPTTHIPIIHPPTSLPFFHLLISLIHRPTRNPLFNLITSTHPFCILR